MDGCHETPHASVIERVTQAMREDKLTQSQLAKQVGYGESTLSRWLKSGYGADTAGIDQEMEKWLNLRGERHTAARPRNPMASKFLALQVSGKVHEKLLLAQLNAELVIVNGIPGVGKTFASVNYRATHPQVWIATMAPSSGGKGKSLSVRAALRLIASEIGVSASGSSDDIYIEICKALRNTSGLLIIDEAQHCSIDVLEQIRAIFDRSEIGVAMVGNVEMGGAKAELLARLHSRVGARLTLGRPSAADVTAVLDAWGVKGDARDRLREIAKQSCALRGLCKTLTYAERLADTCGEAMNSTHIDAAIAGRGGLV